MAQRKKPKPKADETEIASAWDQELAMYRSIVAGRFPKGTDARLIHQTALAVLLATTLDQTGLAVARQLITVEAERRARRIGRDEQASDESRRPAAAALTVLSTIAPGPWVDAGDEIRDGLGRSVLRVTADGGYRAIPALVQLVNALIGGGS